MKNLFFSSYNKKKILQNTCLNTKKIAKNYKTKFKKKCMKNKNYLKKRKTTEYELSNDTQQKCFESNNFYNRWPG